MPEKYKFTYFNLYGAGEPIRLILKYADVNFEDNRIEYQEWSPAHKKNFPWGQLPILEVDGKVLAQSNAICRYLGRKYNLAGKDDWENAKLDEAADAFIDFRNEFGKMRQEKDEAKKEQLTKKFTETVLPTAYTKFNAEWGKNEGPYLLGQNLSWVDIMMAHYLFLIDIFFPGVSEAYPKLTKMQQTVLALPKIKEWIEKRPKTPF